MNRKWTPADGDNNRFQSQESLWRAYFGKFKDKYAHMLSIFVSNLSKVADNIFSALGEFFTKDRTVPKIKQPITNTI